MNFFIYLLFISSFLTPWQFFDVGDYGVTLLDFSILGLFLSFLYQTIILKDPIKVPDNNMTIVLFLFISTPIISSVYPLLGGNANYIGQYFKTLIHFYEVAFIGFIFYVKPPSIKTLENCLKIWLISSIAINFFGIYQIFARLYDLPLAYLDYNNVSNISRGRFESVEDFGQLSLKFENFFRATSIFSEPSALASFNLMIQTFCIVPFFQKQRFVFQHKTLNITIFTFSILAIFFAFSLTGLFGLFLIILFILIFYWKETAKYVFIGIFACAILIIGADLITREYFETSVIELFAERISGILGFGRNSIIDGESFYGRFENSIYGVLHWLKSPITGIGIGQTFIFAKQSGQLFIDVSILAILSELGIIGFILFIMIFTLAFKKGYSFIKSKENSPYSYLKGLLFFWMLPLFINNFLSGNNYISFAFWLNFGWVLMFIRLDHAEKKDSKWFTLKL